MSREPLTDAELAELERISHGLGRQWTADIDEPGTSDEQWTGKWEIVAATGMDVAWRPGEHVDSIECLMARGVASAVTALPRLLAEVRRLRAALGEVVGALGPLSTKAVREQFGPVVDASSPTVAIYRAHDAAAGALAGAVKP